MAIIYTYPQKSQPVSADSLLITDSEDNNATKTVTIADIRDATVSGVESLIAGDNITLDPAGGTGNVTVSTTGEAEKIVEVVYNDTGNTINKGQPLHITGVNGTIPTVNIADASDPTLMPVSGLANEDIPTMSSGEMIVSGILEGIDTNGIDGVPTNAEAVIIYVSDSTGGSIDYLSANAPAGETNQIQNIGIIVKDSPGTSGSLQVTAIGRSNATPNLNEGSIFIGDASNQSSTLAIGTSTHVLTSNGTTASWAAIPAEDLATTLAAGNITGGNNISFDSGDSIIFNNATWTGELEGASLTANRTYALPDQSGIIPVTAVPGAAQDGYVLTWDDTAGEYQFLAAAASGGGIYGGSGSLITDTIVTSANFDLTVNEVSTVRPAIFNVLKGTPPLSKIQDIVASFDWNGVATGFSTTVQISNSVDTGSGSPATALRVNAGGGTLVGQRNGIISNIFSTAGGPMVGITSSVLGGVGVPANSDVAIAAAIDNRTGTSEPNTYGVWSSVSNPAASVITSGYFSATNGTLNYAIITNEAQSGFGTSTPDPSAIVDVQPPLGDPLNPPDKGFKVPQVGGVGAVSPSPTAASAGLIIFDTNTNQFQGWNGTSWVVLG